MTKSLVLTLCTHHTYLIRGRCGCSHSFIRSTPLASLPLILPQIFRRCSCLDSGGVQTQLGNLSLSPLHFQGLLFIFLSRIQLLHYSGLLMSRFGRNIDTWLWDSKGRCTISVDLLFRLFEASYVRQTTIRNVFGSRSPDRVDCLILTRWHFPML